MSSVFLKVRWLLRSRDFLTELRFASQDYGATVISPVPVGGSAPPSTWNNADPIGTERFARADEIARIFARPGQGDRSATSRLHVESIVLDNLRIGICACLFEEANCRDSLDIPVDSVWLNSGYFDGNSGDIHRLPEREAIAKTLVGEGFSSLGLLVFTGLRALPKLDVAGSTPVARSTFSPETSAT